MTKTKALIFGACVLLGVGAVIAGGYLGFSWGWLVTLAATIALGVIFFKPSPGLAVTYAIAAFAYLALTLAAIIFAAIPEGGWHWLQPLGFCGLALWCARCNRKSLSQ